MLWKVTLTQNVNAIYFTSIKCYIFGIGLSLFEVIPIRIN